MKREFFNLNSSTSIANYHIRVMRMSVEQQNDCTSLSFTFCQLRHHFAQNRYFFRLFDGENKTILPFCQGEGGSVKFWDRRTQTLVLLLVRSGWWWWESACYSHTRALRTNERAEYHFFAKWDDDGDKVIHDEPIGTRDLTLAFEVSRPMSSRQKMGSSSSLVLWKLI